MILTGGDAQLDGFELWRAARLPSAARSGGRRQRSVIRKPSNGVLNLGAKAFLSKPVEPETLARVIHPLRKSAFFFFFFSAILSSLKYPEISSTDLRL